MDASGPKSLLARDKLSDLRRKWWYLLLCLAVTIIPIYYFNQTAPPVYQASATVLFGVDHGEGEGLTIPDDRIRDLFLRNRIEEIESRATAEAVAAILPVYSSVRYQRVSLSQTETSDLDIERIQRGLAAAQLRGSDVVRITARSHDPVLSAQIANAVVDIVRRRSSSVDTELRAKISRFLERRLFAYGVDLGEAEKRLAQYVREYHVSLNDSACTIVTLATNAELLHKRMDVDEEVARLELEYLSEILGTSGMTDDVVETVSVGTDLPAVKQQFYDMQTVLIRLLAEGGFVDDGEVFRHRGRIDDIEAELRRETKRVVAEQLSTPVSDETREAIVRKMLLDLQMETRAFQREALGKIREECERSLVRLPEDQHGLAVLLCARDVTRGVRDYVKGRLALASQLPVEWKGDVRVVDRAHLPQRPIRPRKALNLALGVLLGFGAGVLFICLSTAADRTLKLPEQVERIPGLTVVGAIPVEARNPLPADVALGDLPIIRESASPVAEAYRALRTVLLARGVEGSVRSILLSSPTRRGSKTAVAANIGVSTAEIGIKTLLVDGDLRAPRLHAELGVEHVPGIYDILGETVSVVAKSTAHRARLGASVGRRKRLLDAVDGHGSNMRVSFLEAGRRTAVDNLTILPAGSVGESATDVLGCEAMANLLDLAREMFDIILIDSAPVLSVADAAVLSPHVDGVLLVVDSGWETGEVILKAKTAIERVGGSVLGIVLTNVSR